MGVMDLVWMKQAYDHAVTAYRQNEVPIGAVIVNGENQCIGRGWNQVIQLHDPTAHAECQAIREACGHIENYRLENCTLYATLEPCCMCAGALVHARIKRLVFACRDVKAGAAGSVYQLLSGRPLNHRVLIDEGVLYEPCSVLLKDFFKLRR